MSVDVAFESADEIAQKLSRYEQLFKNRYTEADEGYKLCVRNAEKVLHVPVIDPWPPRGAFSRRGRYNRHDDWEGGGGRRRGHRGRRRDNRYHRDPYPPRYYDDRAPPPGNWAYGHRSPREEFRDRSPHRALSPHPHPFHRHGSSSPIPHPPPSSHLSPRPPHPHHRSRSRSLSPAPPSRSPLRDRDSESASGQEAPPTVPHLLNLDLDERDERIPSESDVQDILSFAHAPQSQVTAENLHLAKMEGIKSHKSRQQDPSRTGKKLLSSGHGRNQDNVALLGQGSGLLVTHGRTEAVSTSYLLGNEKEGGGGGGREVALKKMQKSKEKKTGRDESDEERGFVMRGAGEPRGTGKTGGGGEGLVMRLDKKFCHSNSESSLLSNSVPNTPSSDLTPTFPHTSLPHPHQADLKVVCSRLPDGNMVAPTLSSSLPPTPTLPLPQTSSDSAREKKRKKKKKKKKKSSADKEEVVEGEAVMAHAPLKLKITFGKSSEHFDS